MTLSDPLIFILATVKDVLFACKTNLNQRKLKTAK